jgi:uncharacterized protein (TIGR03790 family)
MTGGSDSDRDLGMKSPQALLLSRAALAMLQLTSLGWGSLQALPLEEAMLKDAEATVVVFNTNDPEARGLADFYCEARHIDPTHQIGLAAPLGEEISRPDFEKSIEAPLLEEFVARGYWQFTRDPSGKSRLASTRVGYLVLIKGIPLKIAPYTPPPPPAQPSSGSTDASGAPSIQPPPAAGASSSAGTIPISPRAPARPYLPPSQGSPSRPVPPPSSAPPAFQTCNAASVDSELSVMGFFHHPILGLLRNPYCINESKQIAKSQIPPNFLMVARLDAPTADAVRRMILDGIRVEKAGLWGWGITDSRSIREGTYKLGDDWVRMAAAAMRQKGIPVLSDDLPDTIQGGFPLTDVSAYYGWYSGSIDGPFADPQFRFVPGAVAFHLHSFSANTLRDANRGWTSPLIMHGAAASLGNVYEPYLGFTTNLGTLAWVLVTGHNLAESYYAAQPVLSWMSILVGDPLYRPYARLIDPAGLPDTKWTDFRRIILAHKGSVLDAAADLARRAKQTHESLYLEALGAAQYDAGLLRNAETSFKGAASLTKDPEISFRLLLEQVRALEKLGNKTKAIALLAKELDRNHSDAQQKLILNWMTRIDPKNFPDLTRP